MKIVTVNVPESYIEAIEKLVGENGFYPSRSELIREAARQFLIKEIKLAKEMKLEIITPEVKEIAKEIENIIENDDELIQVPITKKTDNDEPVQEFKTYKVLRKLDYSDTNKTETQKPKKKQKAEKKKSRDIYYKKRKKLGNIFWEDQGYDDQGNMIRVPKQELNF